MVSLIAVVLILGAAFLAKNALRKNSIEAYILVLIGGIVTFCFEPVIFALNSGGAEDGGGIQIASEIFGAGFVIWAIMRLVKMRKPVTK